MINGDQIQTSESVESISYFYDQPDTPFNPAEVHSECLA